MAFNFPNSPVEGQQFLAPGGPVYQYTSGAWTLMGGSAAPAPLSSYRNRIVNGDFVVDQRNAGAAITVSTATQTYGPDRWFGLAAAPGQFLLRQIADPFRTGNYILSIQCSVIDASLAAGDYDMVAYKVEGYDLRDFSLGTSTAKTFTISFDVNSAILGTFPISFRNGALDRSYVTSYTIGTINTWERKTITVAGDVTGTWLYTNGIGMFITFGLAGGTTFQASTANTWGAGSFFTLAGMTNFMTTATTNQIFIRDVQLEAGTVATEFERLPYDVQLMRCQRYYNAVAESNQFPIARFHSAAAGSVYNFPISHPTTMRVVPTATKVGTWFVVNTAQPVISSAGRDGFSVSVSPAATGDCYFLPDDAGDKLTFSAEL